MMEKKKKFQKVGSNKFVMLFVFDCDGRVWHDYSSKLKSKKVNVKFVLDDDDLTYPESEYQSLLCVHHCCVWCF
jgi:hypothetical protein